MTILVNAGMLEVEEGMSPEEVVKKYIKARSLAKIAGASPPLAGGEDVTNVDTV